MLASTEQIQAAGLGEEVFHDGDLAWVFGGTAARRHALVNKALARGELLRLRRGWYMLAERYRRRGISRYHVACRLIGGSYVSAESALAYHGVIPERVTGTYCVRYQGRALEFETPVGFFAYRPVPTTPYRFLEGVRREIIEDKPCLMAGPLRALADLVYLRQLDWQGRPFLTDGLRLDLDPFHALPDDDVEAMAAAFRSRRVRQFLRKMQQEVRRP